MPEPKEVTVRVGAAMEPVRELLVAAIELGNAVDAYFKWYGYDQSHRNRMPDPDRVVWDALQKWRGLM